MIKKNNNGITLISLIVTLIILMIITGTSIQIGNLYLNDSVNDKMNIELSIVRQAISEQYMKAAAVNELKVNKDSEKVRFWVGTQLDNIDEEDLPDGNATSKVNDKFEVFKEYDSNNVNFQEELYYKLNPEDLSSIGVIDAKDEYIVNYKTKEVYNCTKKVNENSEILYLAGD